MIKEIRKTISSANINFLFGSGLSTPFLEMLNDVETFLSDNTKTPDEHVEKKKEYFTKVMLGNLEIISDTSDHKKDEVLLNYKTFYKLLNNIVLHRENPILTKQVNIFTTNIDVFSEKALEETGLEFNDGFQGRFNPVFNLGNFKKSYFKKSLHYEKTSEIPVFNLLKIHGSLTWKYDAVSERILLDGKLDQIKTIETNKNLPTFNDCYQSLMIVNPTKNKYEETVLRQYHYDLIRIYCNELEKESSVLFVMGFSFADKHLRDMTSRVADSNPTLKVFIFVHEKPSEIYKAMEAEAKNKNIQLVLPEDGKKYNFQTINSEIFEKILPRQEEVLDPVEEENAN